MRATKDSKQILKRLGFIGIGLCAACCALPMVAVLFGAGVLTFISGLLEIAGIITVIAVITLLAIYYLKRRKAPACDIDCARKEQEHRSDQKPLG